MQFGIQLDALCALNPNVEGLDKQLFDQQIRIPELSDQHPLQSILPFCSTPPVPETAEWIPLTPLKKMEETEYDVLIVGTGAGGGAVLRRLAERLNGNGKRIGILERGGLMLPTHVNNIATMTDPTSSDYFTRMSVPVNSDYGTRLIFALGGRTLFWRMASPRMPDSFLASWPVSQEEMSFYYRLSERAMSVTQDFTKEAAFTQVMLRRLQERGFPEAVDAPLAYDLEPSGNGLIRTNTFFSSIVWLGQALNYSYDLGIHARVVEVHTEKGRATGVKVMTPDMKTYSIKAKHVVLSAGTLPTPQILLNSGIQGNAIGHYLTGHSRTVTTGVVNRKEFPEMLGTVRILVPGTGRRPYQIQIDSYYNFTQYFVVPLQEQLAINYLASGVVESRYDNKVTLDPYRKDAYGVPELKVDFSYSEQDMAIIRQMQAGVEQAAVSMGVTVASLNNEPAVCLFQPGLELHEMGTCRMGDDPMTSATNRYGQIHGIEGLYVADGSVIPSSGTANPTLTIVALAMRTADYIVAQMK